MRAAAFIYLALLFAQTVSPFDVTRMRGDGDASNPVAKVGRYNAVRRVNFIPATEQSARLNVPQRVRHSDRSAVVRHNQRWSTLFGTLPQQKTTATNHDWSVL